MPFGRQSGPGFSPVKAGFNQMGVQLSCVQSLIEENRFIFHMLPYKYLSIYVGPIAHFRHFLFKSWLKAFDGFIMLL